MTQAAVQVYQPVNLDRERIVLKLYDRYGKKFPEIFQDYSASQKARTLEDFRNHLIYLQESLAINDAAIFLDYAAWARVLFASLHLPDNYLSSTLEELQHVLHEEVPPDLARKTDDYLTKSIAFLATAPKDVPSFIHTDNPFAGITRQYLDFLLAADRNAAITIINEQVKSGVRVRDIYLNILEPALREVGRLWQMQKVSISEEHYVTGATQLILAQLHMPFMAESRNVKRRGKTLVAACVSEELHEVGMRMVADFFEMDGWDTYYIGANTPAPGLIATVKARKAAVVALSSTMSYHLPRVDYLIRSLRGDPDTRQVKIIIGGYPFNIVPDLWQKVGANAYAGSAEDAVAAANRLTSGT
jgi:methanogenic corrinoid protein MtbC1